jgi:hypothetical protein
VGVRRNPIIGAAASGGNFALMHTFPVIARTAVMTVNANSTANQIPMHIKFCHGAAYFDDLA